MTVVVRATVEKYYDFPEYGYTFTQDDIREAILAAKSDFAAPDGAIVVDESWAVSL